MKIIYPVVIAILLFSCGKKKNQISLYVDEELKESVTYGIKKLENQLQLKGTELIISESKNEASLVLEKSDPKTKQKNDGFTLKKESEKFMITSEENRGLLYGLQEIEEQLASGKKWEGLSEKSIEAHYPFRAIKFNLPWFSYRSGKNLSLHYKTCRDLKFWESFLDMMAENKFNALTLWNLHPYIYMVQPTNFPKASPFTNEEFKVWQSFWKSLFKMAKDRGIETYIVNWNIFVSEEFSKAYGMADYSKSSGFWGEGETNELIEKYTREIITQTINEYDDLTGIGITLGERMGGMTSKERKDWIDRTLIAGLKSADREARLLYRAPLSAGKDSSGSTSVSTERITREALKNLDLKEDVLVEFKYNWSHAHSSPKVSIVHGGILTDTYWKPEPSKYKGIWTMRNEDFFALRWAQPDFIRAFMKNNSQSYIGGCIIGSEIYIPAKDYITREEFKTWNYAFERQWLFYKIWGNLLFNGTLSDDYFENALAKKFNLKTGKQLLSAWKLASMNANRFASFHRGTWDATIYTEGFTTVGGKFIDIEKFIKQPVLDSSYVNIQDFVKQEFKADQITPLQLAETTQRESTEALRISTKILKENPKNQELLIELNDIFAWSYYGFYFTSKIKAGVALEKYRQTKDKKFQQQAITELEQGSIHWKKLTEVMEKYNVSEMPYQFDPNFSWRKHIVDVEKDIEIAKRQ